MSDSESDYDIQQDEKEIEDLRNVNVVNKYRLASDICNEAIKFAIAECKSGARIVDVCQSTDDLIDTRTGSLFKGKNILKGVGFPTCVSVNNIVGCFSPMKKDTSELKDGDLVKIDLGVHLDGYIVTAAHSFVLGAAAATPIDGRKADVLAACYTAANAALRLLKPGTSNTEITALLEQVAADYKCSTVEGVLSHQIRRFEIAGEKIIQSSKPEVPLTGDQKIKDIELEAHEVYALDIVMSTGDGKPQETDRKETTVYRRYEDGALQLKLKTARAVYGEVSRRFPHFPFTARALEYDENKVQFGCNNAAQNQLLEVYPVMREKDGEFVAQIKFTVLLLPDNSMQVTGLPWDASQFKSEFSPSEEVQKVLALPIPKKKKNKKKKNKKKKKSAAAAQ
jgi:ERBB-3 binding protein